MSAPDDMCQAAMSMRDEHPPTHERHQMWEAMATLLVSVAEHIASHDCEAHCEPDGCNVSHDARAVARAYLGAPR